jgi:hypothetical protein
MEVVLFALLSMWSVQAQLLPSDHGWIEGKVSDPTGAAIARTIVTAINESTKQEVTTTTDDAGSYRFLGLIPGSYRLRFAAQGFATATRDHVLASSAKITQLDDVRLQVGTGGGVEVIGVPPAVGKICRGGPDVSATNNPMPDETESAVSIQGRVADSIGMAVPARITAFEYSTEKLYTSTTDSEGVYRLRGLPEGNYCLVYQAGEWGTGSAGNGVTVSTPQLTTRDIQIPALPEKVEVCNCLLETTVAEPAKPGIAIHIYAEHNVAYPGEPLWLTVTLTNMTKHPISIRNHGEPHPGFVYEIYAAGRCYCPFQLGMNKVMAGSPGQEPRRQGSANLLVRVPPGGTVTDRVDLNRLMDWRYVASSGPTFDVWVSRFDTSGTKHGEETKDLPVVRSNSIKVALLSRN